MWYRQLIVDAERLSRRPGIVRADVVRYVRDQIRQLPGPGTEASRFRDVMALLESAGVI